MELTLRIIIGILVASAASYAYNRLVERLEADGSDEGYMSLIVTGGVAMVLLVAAAATWGYTLTAATTIGIVALLFVAAGVPMILGSIGRYNRRRQRIKRALDADAIERLKSIEW